MKKRFWLRLSILIGFGMVYAYSRLSDSKKRYIAYLVRQIPYLPARYSV
jgi:hypothetical protein